MKSCLIVDDSRVIRKVSRHILETLGFQVEEAENGQEGLDKCAESMPDKPKVVFCTTENDVAHIREAINAGADEYVMKPFDHETLQIKLQLVGMA